MHVWSYLKCILVLLIYSLHGIIYWKNNYFAGYLRCRRSHFISWGLVVFIISLFCISYREYYFKSPKSTCLWIALYTESEPKSESPKWEARWLGVRPTTHSGRFLRQLWIVEDRNLSSYCIGVFSLLT